MALSKISNDMFTTISRPNSKPIIVNGDCAVSQRSTSATGKTASGLYAVDRMALGISSLGTWTVAQESITSGDAFNAGFTKAFRIDCTTADGSPGSGDNIFFQYKLEGNSVQSFKKGTSNAEKFTLAFWVKSNKTGTGQVLLIDQDNSRHVGATYAISSADTWEHKICNFAADTTGAFDNDNAKSLEIEWALDAGSDFTSGAVPSSWESKGNTDRSVNDFALGDNTANDWAITGIQLEVGEFNSSTLPPFQHESYAENLLRCQRYLAMNGNNAAITGSCNGATQFNSASLWVPVAMRGTPSVENFDQVHVWFDDGTAFNDTSIAIANIKHIADTNSIYFNINSLSGMTDNKMCSGYLGTGDDATKVQWDAEL